MPKRIAEWDPSWDDDWQTAQRSLEQEIEEERPPDPRKAVEYYRYGFVVARRHPMHEWPEVEQNIYEDFMTAQPETGEYPEESGTWEEAREWAHRGWEEARA